MDYKVSVIIPIYNGESYLHRCIDSILNQSFKAFELLLIDDGSTDSTFSICSEYASIDNRIKMIRLKNGGVGNARNQGLSMATGDYVCFVDCDDYVTPNYIKNLISHSNDCDMVISSAIYESDDKRKFAPSKYACFGKSKLCQLVEEDIITRKTFPWAKLYKRSIIEAKSLSFPIDMPIGEDAVFLFSYISVCNTVKVVSDCDYIYQVAMEDSLTKKRYSVEKELKILQQIYSSTQSLIDALQISSSSAIANITRLRQSYIIRVLDSIYFVERLPRSRRLEIIASLPQKEVTSMPVISSLRAKVLASLLNLHLFRTYDMTRALIAKNRHSI